MAHIVLHIGTHKTATTTIQSLFREGANVLAKHGVIYPKLDEGNAHHICAGNRKSWSSKDGAKSGSENAYDILVRRYADRDDTVFVSSEEFSRYEFGKTNFVDFEKIRKLLAPFETVKVVCVLRCQWQFMQSAYMEITKMRTSPQPAQMVENALYSGTYDGLAVDYNLLLNRLEQFFNPDEITFYDYDTICRTPDGIIGGFLRHLNLPLRPDDLVADRATDRNVSVAPLARWAANELVTVAKPELLDVANESLQSWAQAQNFKNSIFTAAEIETLNAHFKARNDIFSQRRARVQPGFEITGYDIPENTIFRDQINARYWKKVAKHLSGIIGLDQSV